MWHHTSSLLSPNQVIQKQASPWDSNLSETGETDWGLACLMDSTQWTRVSHRPNSCRTQKPLSLWTCDSLCPRWHSHTGNVASFSWLVNYQFFMPNPELQIIFEVSPVVNTPDCRFFAPDESLWGARNRLHYSMITVTMVFWTAIVPSQSTVASRLLINNNTCCWAIVCFSSRLENFSSH